MLADRLDEALERLDEEEAAVQDLLHRVVITTATGVKAWVYKYYGDTQFTGLWQLLDAKSPAAGGTGPAGLF